MNNMDSKLWEMTIHKIVESYEEETGKNYFGYDSYGNPYTYEDALSSYQDSEYHAMREEE